MKPINLTLRLLFLLLFTNLTFGQTLYPGGDSCNTAIPIPEGNYFTDADGCEEFDHWYQFTAPCDGSLTICNDGANEMDKRIYSGVCGSLTLLQTAGWNIDCTAPLAMPAGSTVYINVDDSWDCVGQFEVAFDGCDDVDSSLLDIKGYLYYDLNNNGIRDGGEVGKFLNPIITDPAGVYTVTGLDGFYYSSVTDLDDDTYEVSPTLDDYWRISSDSLVYTLIVDDDYEQRDSLDFGIYPDTLVYEVNAELISTFPRCNDTINYSLYIQNTGTTIASGRVHLELHDSLYYVDADVLPDSIVGQDLYWHYENLFYNESEIIAVQVGTPDGVEDTVTNNFTVTVDTGDVEMFSTTDIVIQEISCAYDPNDKTPTPLGQGPLGYISPETESIEYLIRFQNTGTDTAFNVVIKDQLDENLDWYTITPLAYSHLMTMDMNIDGEVSFIFNNIMLPDSNVNYTGSQGYVKYRVDLKPGLPLETSIYNTANIYFDLNPAVVTNTTVNTLFVDGVHIDELVEENHVVVYPNPFRASTTVYYEANLENHSIQIVDLLGKLVYRNNELNGNKLEIEAGDFKSGMYVLLLVDNELNETISTTKLIVK